MPWVANTQHELQVGDRLLGPLPVRRQAGQGEPAQVLGQAQPGLRGLVQLGQRRAAVLAQPGLEVAGKGQRQRLARLGVCLLLEEAVPVSVCAGGSEPGGEDDQRGLVGAGPSCCHLEGFDVTLAGDRTGHEVILCGFQSAAAAGTVGAAGPAVSAAAGEGTGWRRRGTRRCVPAQAAT